MTSTSAFDDRTHCRPSGFLNWLARHLGKVIFAAIAAVLAPIAAHFFVPPAIAYLEPHYDRWFNAQQRTDKPPLTVRSPAVPLQPPTLSTKALPPAPIKKRAAAPSSSTRARRSVVDTEHRIHRRHFAFEAHSIPIDACTRNRSECGTIAVPKHIAHAKRWKSNLGPSYGYWTVYTDHILFHHTYYVCPQGIRRDRHLFWKTKTKPVFHPFAVASTQAEWERFKARKHEPTTFWEVIAGK